jgi:flagellar capping protein FliD
MSQKNTLDLDLHNKVKGIVRSLGLDTTQLAEKLDSNIASVSRALNGQNEKLFNKILVFLSEQHGITSLHQHLDSAVGRDIAEIKTSLLDLQNAIERLEQGMRDLQEEIKKK